jgi:hypothetical protein
VREGLDRVLTVRFDDEAGSSRIAIGDEEPVAGQGEPTLADTAFEGSEAAD